MVQRADEATIAVADLYESKLHPPPNRSGLVPRTHLLDRLVESRDARITSVVAPPGYGKTTLLADWARRDPTRFAWLSIDRADNDLRVLMSYMTAALDRVEPIDAEILTTVTNRRSVSASASSLPRAMSAMTHPIVFVLDHVEALHNQDCLDAIAELALHLPPDAHLAMASRQEPPLPMPRLRASGHIVEIGIDDLAMTTEEAKAVLGRGGVELDEADLAALLDRTEGWPVGLYLAALALKAGGSRQTVAMPFSGDDRLMADYLRAEVLSGLATDDVAFLTRTSVVERMSGRLCDALLEGTGSAEQLEALARSNLFVLPLDRQGRWYRFHHLLRDLLRAELDRREPELVPRLHVRAADWYEVNGVPELAIEHAMAGSDVERANRLFLNNAAPAYAAGRVESVRRWLRWFDAQGVVEEYPAVAILGALLFSSLGETVESERLAIAAHELRPGGGDPTASAGPERRSSTRILPDGSTLESWRAVLRVLLARDGPDGLAVDAELALDGLGPSSGFRPVAMFFQGESYVLKGAPDRAEPIFAHAADVGRQMGRLPAALAATAERGFIACGRGEWADAEERSGEAMALVESASLEEYADSGLAFVLAARVASHGGDGSRADQFVTCAARLRPQLTYSRPVVSLRTLLELARVYVALGDAPGARVVLRQARDILRQRPNMGVLGEQFEALRSTLEGMRARSVGASSLTAAELRLVSLLSTHLTFPEIGERLAISRHTVKSHAISIYQKLGVSSRSEAVKRLREVGLLEG